MQIGTSKYIILVLMAFLLSFQLSGYAQKKPRLEGDVQKVNSNNLNLHSPKKATLLSAVLPGAGQFYNKKYWKIPVIYLLEGALVYNIINKNKNYHKYLDAYTYLYNNKKAKLGFEAYSLDQLKSEKDGFRTSRDLSIIGAVLIYVLNIIDATVDGYLYDFDVSDDLSLKIKPHMFESVSTNRYPLSGVSPFGLSFSLTF